MNQSRRRNNVMWACALAVSLLPALAVAVQGQVDGGAEAPGGPIATITKASGDVTMSFVRPGRVSDLYVKVGDEVTAGTLLAKQDDTEEQAAVEVAASQAADTTKITAQEKIRDEKEKVYERKAKTDAVNEAEKEEALLDWEVSKAQLELAKFEHMQDGQKLKQGEAVLQKTKLISPINGVVQQVMLQAGESVDAQSMKVIRIVNVDPLWIDVPVPFEESARVKVGDVAHVAFSDKQLRDGKVLALSPVGDTASASRLVRVAVPNPDRIPAGERVMVTFVGDGKVAANSAP